MAKAERSVATVIEDHEASGKYFTVNGMKIFALQQGRGIYI